MNGSFANSTTLPDVGLFQLLRTLECQARMTPGQASGAIGHDLPIHREFADFTVVHSLAFAASSCTKIETTEGDGLKKSKLHIACFGLTGPSGVMPLHYTELLSDRGREKDTAFGVLMDGFNARAISFLYRAWQKNRLAIAQEHTSNSGHQRNIDPSVQMLKSYTGLGIQEYEQSGESKTESLAFYFSGYYSKRPRNAAALKSIISSVLQCDASIQQFHGRWFELEPEQRNTIGCSHATLGKDFVIGNSVFEGSCSIRIKTAPVSLAEFKQLRPGQPKYQQLQELIQLYVGRDYLMDLQVVLKGAERPPFRITHAKDPDQPLRLGEGLWLSATASKDDVADAIYDITQ
ncbi:type VI secretion system baseplate subunit TssG [Neptunomonas sp.]|uniref:type VI secretion system baseplate subunit TssG n=1 Tax=Neptunomonas sp. TaxID=1971898 RepID=UPI0025FF7323|nr:type VI secretion system baseplate subunit TssG [Neptunomonas sp.]